jgi:hypothetical protein
VLDESAPAAAGGQASTAAAAGAEEGGEAACWAHLVCSECGAIVSEGHAAGCGFAAAGPSAP